MGSQNKIAKCGDFWYNERSNKNMSKIVYKIAIFCLLILGIGIFLYSPVIFQEGNPWPPIQGIVRLTFGQSNMVQLFGSDNKYLTKNKGGWEIMNSFLENKGYKFTEQMGSGYFYQSSDGSIVLVRRQYSRFYVIWAMTENKK